MILKYFYGGCHIMKTTMLKKVLAMVTLVMVLVSMFSVTASAAAPDWWGKTNGSGSSATAAEDNVSNCSTTLTGTKKTHSDVCKALKAMYGNSANVAFYFEETSNCKYNTSVEVNAASYTIWVSVKTQAEDLDINMGDDNKLVIQGINGDDTSAWNQLFARFKGVIVGLTGVGTLVMIVLFIIQFMKLGASAGNPQARSQALTGVLWTGVAAALLGSVTIIVGFFYNAL
jgi:hypothetical protein